VSNVKNMRGMFSKSKFNGDVSQWVVSNGTRVHGMFYFCPLKNLPQWFDKAESEEFWNSFEAEEILNSLEDDDE